MLTPIPASGVTFGDAYRAIVTYFLSRLIVEDGDGAILAISVLEQTVMRLEQECQA